MRPRDGKAELCQQRFQILLGAPLTVETHAVMQGRLASTASPGDDAVGFGLSHPF
jgi:hypothetical protein